MNKANKEPVILGLVTSSLIRHENKQEKSRGKVCVRTSSLWAVRRGLLGTFLCMEGDQSVGSWGGPGSEVCRQSSSNVTGRPDGLVLLQLPTQGMACTSIALRRLRSVKRQVAHPGLTFPGALSQRDLFTIVFYRQRTVGVTQLVSLCYESKWF